jgi:hypothetical protein
MIAAAIAALACTAHGASGSAVSKVQAGWDNHFAAFAAQDVEKILLDYTEDSQIITYDMGSGAQHEYKGLAGVREAFVGLFAELSDLSTLDAPVIRVEDETTPSPQVFLMWACPSSGIYKATDTFAFDKTGKITRQNVVLWRTVPVAAASPPVNLNTAKTGGATQAGWDNHFAAFGAQNLTKILLDYTEESQVIVYDITTGVEEKHTGIAGATTLFTGLFKALFDNSKLAAPLVVVEESPQPQVLLIWESPASGFIKVTDTFLFNDKGKIIRQNVVVQSAGPVHKGWDNHFAAFGAQDVEKILLDYTEESEIITYDMNTGDQHKFTGLAGVRKAFEGLFAELSDLSGLAAPVVRVEAGFDVIQPQVFLMWACPTSGVHKATDTFAFDAKGKIIRQNVVYWRKQTSSYYIGRKPSTTNLNTAKTTGLTQAGWDNHFAAFGAQNLTKILLDYVQQSQVIVYDITTEVETVYHALKGTDALFTGLFKGLYDNSKLAAPLIVVEESPQPQVLLIWESPASGFLKVTDTFLFNDKGQIIRQNVVAQSGPADTSSGSGSASALAPAWTTANQYSADAATAFAAHLAPGGTPLDATAAAACDADYTDLVGAMNGATNRARRDGHVFSCIGYFATKQCASRRARRDGHAQSAVCEIVNPAGVVYQRTEIKIDAKLAEKMADLCKPKTEARERRFGHATGAVDLSCEAGKKAANEFGEAFLKAGGSSFTMADVKELKITFEPAQAGRRERRAKHAKQYYVDITFKASVTAAAVKADVETVSKNTPFDVVLPAGSAIAGTWATPKQTIATGEVKGFEKRTSGAATAVATAAAALSVFAMAL